MIKIREVLRLRFEARLTERQIAAAVGVSRSTVQQCLLRAGAVAITWPLPPEPDEGALGARLYPQPHATPASAAMPDFAVVHQELKRPGVTRELLWREYQVAPFTHLPRGTGGSNHRGCRR